MAEQDRLNQYLQILSETKNLRGEEIPMYYHWNPGSKEIVDEFRLKTSTERAVLDSNIETAHSYKGKFDQAVRKFGFEEAILAIDTETAIIEPEDLPDWYQAHPKASEIMQKIHSEIDHR